MDRCRSACVAAPAWLCGGRLSWWIPPVGAIVTFLIVSVCLVVPLFGDADLLRGVALGS